MQIKQVTAAYLRTTELLQRSTARSIKTEEDVEPASEKTLELEMADPSDPSKTKKNTIYFYNNFDDIFPADMTVERFCTLLAEYWGFSGYTLGETVDEEYFDEPVAPVEASTLLLDLPADTAENYYLTVFFKGDQEGAPVYISLDQLPGYVMLSAGVTHAVG